MADNERRRSARHPLARPAKVRCLQTGRYLAARTQNVSSNGALLEIDHPSLLVSGQQVSVAVAWSRRDAVLKRDDMYQATVVRSLGLGGRQHVAVVFAGDIPLALSA